jgi:hypothetical protein
LALAFLAQYVNTAKTTKLALSLPKGHEVVEGADSFLKTFVPFVV